jgi:excisionase family DNA binding protein
MRGTQMSKRPIVTEPPERLMTLADLSEMLGVPVTTLYAWRCRGEGPSGYRIGRHVRYRRSLVEAWIEGQADPAREP